MIILSYSAHSFANQDSLWAIWNNEAAAPSKRLATLQSLYDLYEFASPDSLLSLVEMQIEYATEQQDTFWLANALGNQAELYSLEGQFDEALIHYNQAVELFEQIEKLEGVGYLYLEIGYNEYARAQVEPAFQYWEKARQLGIKYKQYDLVSTSLNALGATHRDYGDLVKGLNLLLQQAHLFETKEFDRSKAIDPYADIATIYYKLNELDSALLYIDKALTYNDIHNPDKPKYNAIPSGYKGQILEKQGKVAAARRSYQQMLDLSVDSLYEEDLIYPLSTFSEFLFNQQDAVVDIYIDSLIHLAEKYNYRTDLAIGYTLKGKLLLAEGNNIEALSLCQSASNLLGEDAPIDELRMTYDCLYQSHKALQNYEQALIFYERSQQLKEEELNEKSVRKLTQLEMKAIAAREKATAQLAYENKLQRQRLIQDGLICGLGLLGLLVFISYRNYRNKAKANELIEAQKQRLEELNITKDRLFAIIGHDLRKPSLAFRGIGKKVDYLLKKEDYNMLSKLTNTLEKAAFSLNSLLDNLLSWALQQREVLPYQPQTINVAEATSEIYDYFHDLAAEKDIDLSFNFSEQTQIFADPNAFTTIVRNLVDNAIKFTPENGKVKLSGEIEAEEVVLKVEDTGVGMEQGFLKHLFQLQKNKSHKGTSGERGAGLGLTLVAELVKLNKGRIVVNSQLNGGTTFKITLPVA
ncbi:MAG: ATP-binding protein [Bacteroidota bacterium]